MKRKDTLGRHISMSIVEDQDEIDNLVDTTPVTPDINSATLKIKGKFPETF